MREAMTDLDVERFIGAEFDRRQATVRSYFASHSAHIAQTCHHMAERFARGGRILAFGVGAAATDAQHVSVEFVHPVVVGKRALPAIALPNDGPTLLGTSAHDPDSVFTHAIEMLGHREDIAMGFILSSDDPGVGAVSRAMEHAAAAGMLTIGLTGPQETVAEHAFATRESDPFIIQEVQETAYHVMWELVHVFFEHKGLLEGRAAGPRHDVGASSFLYPFLSEGEADLDSVLGQVQQSILKKAEDVIAMRAASAVEDAPVFAFAARLLAERFTTGGKMLAFGNGGSATDAQDLVTDLMTPLAGRTSRPALALTNEDAVLTAVGNDVGFENVFSRQIIAYGLPGDAAVGISTSGGSRNVLAAFEAARRRDLACIGFAGYGGGEIAARELCDAAFVIDHEYIPRIQEAQASQYHILLRLLDLMT